MHLSKPGKPFVLPSLRVSAITALTLAGAATLTAACAHDVQTYATCMDPAGHILPASYCGQPGYLFYMSQINYYGGGYQLIGGFYAPLHSTTVVQFNSTQINNFRNKGTVFNDNDSAARQRAGLPSTGTVAGGTKGAKVSSKGGALDSSHGSGAKGGGG
jgi:hypothetical protein